MRWVNVVVGIKQRFNDLWGKGTVGADPADNEPNYWSIQSAMLTNLRRIVKGISANSSKEGRVMSGCWIGSNAQQTIDIGKGSAFTSNGDIIVFEGGEKFITGYTSSVARVYLKHVNTEIQEDSHPTIGKNVNIIGETGTREIINDDSSVIGADVIVLSPSQIADGDHVFLGTVELNEDDEIASINNTLIRGLSPNNANGEYEVNKLKVKTISTLEDLIINGTVNGSVSFSSGTIDFESVSGVKLPATGLTVDGVNGLSYEGPVTDIIVKNGIVTQATAPV